MFLGDDLRLILSSFAAKLVPSCIGFATLWFDHKSLMYHPLCNMKFGMKFGMCWWNLDDSAWWDGGTTARLPTTGGANKTPGGVVAKFRWCLQHVAQVLVVVSWRGTVRLTVRAVRDNSRLSIGQLYQPQKIGSNIEQNTLKNTNKWSSHGYLAQSIIPV